MCTVSFIPKSTSQFIFTSNRDEAPNRKTLAPEVYKNNHIDLLFPKDELAGGTWIGVSSQKRLVCLLNGGFRAHDRMEKYRMSRGIIVTELLSAENATIKINEFNFEDIEPFTVLLVDWRMNLQLHELVWDGVNVHFSEKPLVPQIWSSSLLYSEKVKLKREEWFSKFIQDHQMPTENEVLSFHKTAGEGNLETNLIMDKGFVKTKSITQLLKIDNISMRYEDLESERINNTVF
jgi:hypothetical protein